MPLIISTNSDPGALGPTLSRMGEQLFANQALREMQRQTALKTQRENAAAPLAAQAYRDNNPVEFGAQSILGDRSGADVNAYNLSRSTAAANGDINNPALNVQLLANGRASPVATAQSEQNQGNINLRNTLAVNAAKPETAFKNGQPVFARAGDLTNPANGYSPIITPQQALTGAIMSQPSASQPAQPQPQSSSPQPASAQPAQATQYVGGFQEQPVMERLSQPAMAPLIAQDPQLQTAVYQYQRQKQAALALPAPPQPDTTQAEKDVYNNAGPLALARKVGNDVAGFVPGLFGAPMEAAPQTERGEQRVAQLTGLTRTMLTALQSGGARNALADRTLSQEAFPHLNLIGTTGGNAVTEQRNVQQFQGYLRKLYGIYQDQALSPGLDPQQAAALQTNLAGLRRLISMWEAPYNPNADVPPAKTLGQAQKQRTMGQAQTPQQPQQQQTWTDPATGQTYRVINGQLVH